MQVDPSAPANGGAQTSHGENIQLAYRVARAARLLDVSPMTLYREIEAGRLPAIRIRGCLLIPRAEIERLLTSPKGGGGRG